MINYFTLPFYIFNTTWVDISFYKDCEIDGYGSYSHHNMDQFVFIEISMHLTNYNLIWVSRNHTFLAHVRL